MPYEIDITRLTFSKIAAIVLQGHDPRIRTAKFADAIRDLLVRLDLDDDISRNECGRQLIGFIPDAYLIDEEKQEVVLYEIEDSHYITIEKLMKLVDFWWMFDNVEWTLRLLVTDRYGMNQRELDLFEWSCAFVSMCNQLEGRNFKRGKNTVCSMK